MFTEAVGSIICPLGKSKERKPVGVRNRSPFAATASVMLSTHQKLHCVLISYF